MYCQPACIIINSLSRDGLMWFGLSKWHKILCNVLPQQDTWNCVHVTGPVNNSRRILRWWSLLVGCRRWSEVFLVGYFLIREVMCRWGLVRAFGVFGLVRSEAFGMGGVLRRSGWFLVQDITPGDARCHCCCMGVSRPRPRITRVKNNTTNSCGRE